MHVSCRLTRFCSRGHAGGQSAFRLSHIRRTAHEDGPLSETRASGRQVRGSTRSPSPRTARVLLARSTSVCWAPRPTVTRRLRAEHCACSALDRMSLFVAMTPVRGRAPDVLQEGGWWVGFFPPRNMVPRGTDVRRRSQPRGCRARPGRRWVPSRRSPAGGGRARPRGSSA